MRAAVAILACLASAAVAAPPAPPPSAVKVTVGELARVEITPDAAGGVGWASGAADADLFVDELASRAGKTRLLLQAKRAGTYRVVLWTKGETDSVFVEVVATGAGPTPDPGPKPGPTPEPTPSPDRRDVSYRMVFIEETSTAAAGRGALFTDKPLDARMKEKGHSFRIVDKDVTGADGKPPKDLAPLLDLAAKKTYPQLFLVDKEGKLPSLQFDAPTDAAALIKLLTANGG